MKIEIWETDWHRESGESFIYDETYEDFEIALKSARKLYKDNNYASMMILSNENESLYCCDDESEEFYFDNEKFNFDIVDKFMKIYRNRIKFSPSKEPYITYKLADLKKVLEECKELLGRI